MTPETVMNIGRQTLEITAMLAGPLLISSLIVGLVIAMFQAATQINEMTLSFIPKMLGIFVVLILTGPWIISMLVDYIQRLYGNIPWMIG